MIFKIYLFYNNNSPLFSNIMSDTPTPITFTANTYPTKELPPGRTITNVTFDEDEKKTQNFKVILSPFFGVGVVRWDNGRHEIQEMLCSNIYKS